MEESGLQVNHCSPAGDLGQRAYCFISPELSFLMGKMGIRIAALSTSRGGSEDQGDLFENLKCHWNVRRDDDDHENALQSL